MLIQATEVNYCKRSLATPASADGVLSTRLMDPSPDYVWFDCETEY